MESTFDKLKLASTSLGERIKTGGAQMGRMVSSKMKEILQAPTPESKIVDEATLDTMEEPNWGLNLRICAMINSEDLNGTEIVKAIKKKLLSSGKAAANTQRLSLDLLEFCTSNCEKVFSEVASEKVLDDMVRMIDDPKTEHENRVKAMQLIKAWGENEDLMYLPVFHQTFMNLKTRGTPSGTHNAAYVDPQQISPPERYPIPDNEDNSAYIGYSIQSVEDKKEFLVMTRNTLDILSSILNSESEPKSIKDDLTVSLVDKCELSLPVVQRIVESTSDDEVMMFDALNVHDELQQIITRYKELEAASESGKHGHPEDSEGQAEPRDLSFAEAASEPLLARSSAENEMVVYPKVEHTQSSGEVRGGSAVKEDVDKGSSK